MPVKKTCFPAVASAVCAFGILLTALPASAESPFGDWPEGTSPRFVGTKATERFLSKLKARGTSGKENEMRYPEMVTWYGALTFAKASGQADLTKRLIEASGPLLRQETHRIPPPDHVDRNVFGALAAEISMQSENKQALEVARNFADVQWEPTEEIMNKVLEPGKKQEGLTWRMDDEARKHMEQGLSWQTRYWIDDMYMITMAQGQMFRATGERKYIDRAAKEMVSYLDKLQEPNGLFYHAPDVPFFWGRGNGWMAAGMAELLLSLPEDNPDHARILAGYRKMMATLKATQAESGMWLQLVDDPKSWPETSCTGMFTFAMVTGVKKGWLDSAEYGPVARNAWIALAGYVHGNGDVCEVCVGTNKENSREYYLRRPRALGDMHGQAAVLWSATALSR
ncbi:MAG: glycosyl hydrolase [Verrucomicrobiaceae bacterium]|nr:MAG: glycosyl hydrolase [Verrucomicrobiaceae bacterium]